MKSILHKERAIKTLVGLVNYSLNMLNISGN